MSKVRYLAFSQLIFLAGAAHAQVPQHVGQSQESVIDMGNSSAPAAWLKTNFASAWPGLLIENTSRSAAAQVQLFWKRWDALGNPLVWQINVDVDNNRGFKGLFNMEAIDIVAGTVVATPISMARTGEVGIGTGTPVSGQQLTVGGDTRISRRAGTAVDGALVLGSNNNVKVYGNSAASVLAFYANGNEAARISGGDLLVGTTTDSGDRLQVSGTARVTALGMTPSTVASLPACNADLEGRLASVTDANSTTFNATAAGGGANHMMAYCNGTSWTIH